MKQHNIISKLLDKGFIRKHTDSSGMVSMDKYYDFSTYYNVGVRDNGTLQFAGYVSEEMVADFLEKLV